MPSNSASNWNARASVRTLSVASGVCSTTPMRAVWPGVRATGPNTLTRTASDSACQNSRFRFTFLHSTDGAGGGGSPGGTGGGSCGTGSPVPESVVCQWTGSGIDSRGSVGRGGGGAGIGWGFPPASSSRGFAMVGSSSWAGDGCGATTAGEGGLGGTGSAGRPGAGLSGDDRSVSSCSDDRGVSTG